MGLRRAGPWEAATSLLADYLGFLPAPTLRGRFKDEVIAQLPRDGFTLTIAEFDAWYEHARRTTRPGLVVVAGPSSFDWPAGRAVVLSGAVQETLDAAGFDVYEPGRNADGSQRRSDRRLHGMAHASLLSALDRASMVVVPIDGRGLVHGVESNVALWYALQHPDVPCLIAYADAKATAFADYERFGMQLVSAPEGLPWDVSAVVDAVDHACAAWECLHPSVGSSSRTAT